VGRSGRSGIGVAVGLWLAAALGGCTSLPGPARVEAPSATAGPAFEGLISSDAGRPGVRYIFQTHGINSPGDAWAKQLLDAIPQYGYVENAAAGYDWRKAPLARPMEVTGRDLVCDRPEGCTFTTFGEYRKDVFVDPATHDRVVVFSYRWRDDLWSITGHYVTPDIQENTFTGLSTNHSVLNAKLKINIIDEGLSDAVGYLSSLGALEREGIETAVCAMLSDSIGLDGPPAGAGCLGQFQPADLSRLTEVEFNFLSHSLGSRMLYDVLSGVISENGQAPTQREMQTRGAMRRRTHVLIMAANQMPLLAPSEFHVGPAPATSRPAAPSAFVNLKDPGAAEPASSTGPRHLTVIAFQDPDDLVGFKASDAVIGTNDDSVTFVDVLHRNTSQWAFLLAWPPTAHDGELKEPHSRQMILCGADMGPDGRLKARDCRPAGRGS
jgi:hypothetical protein